MGLSQYQKKLILDNQNLTNEQLCKLVDCGMTTVKKYRKLIKEGKMEDPTGHMVVRNPTFTPAHIEEEASDMSQIYTPGELVLHLSEICRSEHELYMMAKTQIRTHGAEPKVVWDASQHVKNFNQCAVSLGKWFGMEKLTLNTVQGEDITKEKMDLMTNDDIENMVAQCLQSL